ncbi:MAG: serine hydrolase [Chloroflexi bacterium]|nr:serine hydrolase [Chloroflexota bacterium]
MIDERHIAAKPEDVGVDSERLEAVFARVRRDIDDGVLPSAQVAVARQGKIAGLRTFGAAVQDGVERPATDETLYCIYSCTKAIVAAAIWLLFEDELLRPSGEGLRLASTGAGICPVIVSEHDSKWDCALVRYDRSV